MTLTFRTSDDLRRGFMTGIRLSAVLAAGICMSGPANPLSAQWTGGPTGPIYYSGGNVGIGTTAPGYNLDVIGNMSVRNNTSAIGGDIGVFNVFKNSSNVGDVLF